MTTTGTDPRATRHAPFTEAGRRLVEELRPWAEQHPDKFLDGWEREISDIEEEVLTLARSQVASYSEIGRKQHLHDFNACRGCLLDHLAALREGAAR